MQLFTNWRQWIGTAALLFLAIVVGVTVSGIDGVFASEVVSPEECTVGPISELDLVAIVEKGTPAAAESPKIEV